MTAYIQLNTLATSPSISINEEEFEIIKKSRSVLNAALSLEEAYDILLGNYIEFEQELLLIAINHNVRLQVNYQEFFSVRASVNRRIANLLSATRLYLDQVPQRLKFFSQDPVKMKEEVKELTHKHYDTCFSYRFLEALRNHVQHFGLCVHSITFNNKRHGIGADAQIDSSVLPFSEKLYLGEDKDFKKTILVEMPEKVALTSVIREYIKCIGDIHKYVRDCLEGPAEEARTSIQGFIEAYAKINENITLGLCAFRGEEDDEIERVPLMLDWDDVRLSLVEKNPYMAALPKNVVMGRSN